MSSSEMPSALLSLVSRHSLGVKHLSDPGPSEAQLQWLLAAALRAPDHASLVPFRFVWVPEAAKPALADLFEGHARRAGKSEQAVAIERERALKAPLTLAVLACIDHGHPQVPAHEQWMCIGGAVTNLLNAAHALGFAAKILSGDKVRSPDLINAFCRSGEQLVGWICMGTADRELRSRETKLTAQQVARPWRSR